jgi:hypothetical protein
MARGPESEAMRAAGVRVKKVAALHLRQVPGDACPELVFFDDDAFLLPLRHRGHLLFALRRGSGT